MTGICRKPIAPVSGQAARIEFAGGDEWDEFWIKGEGARISKEKGIKGEILTLPVGSFPQGVSFYGLLDMAGNVANWVEDWYNPNYYRAAPLSDPTGPERGAIKAMRGGSWLKPAVSLRATDRDWGTMDSRPSGTGPVRQGCALGFALRAHHTIGKDNQGVIRFSTRHGGEQGIKESFRRQQSSMIRRKHALLAENG